MNKSKLIIIIAIILIAIIFCSAYKIVGVHFDTGRFLSLINESRLKENKQQLNLNQNLSEVARQRSQDMINRNYFSHYTPEGTRVRYGEIIAYGLIEVSKEDRNCNLTLVFNDNNFISAINFWLSSKSHKDILLDGKYKNIGIGYAYNNKKYIITILFSSR